MSDAVSLSLLVLRCADLERSREFYEQIGLSFAREQHGGGPSHYSCKIGDTVLELYPKGTRSTSDARLGFALRQSRDITDDLVALGGKLLADNRPSAITILDPDGHTLDLTFAPRSFRMF